MNPVAGVDLDATRLREQAGEIRERRREFARRMGRPEGDESSCAQSTRMYQ